MDTVAAVASVASAASGPSIGPETIVAPVLMRFSHGCAQVRALWGCGIVACAIIHFFTRD